MVKLSLKSLKIPCLLGVYENECRHPQMLEVNADFFYFFNGEDELEEALDYQLIVEGFKKVASSRRFKLIETLASAFVNWSINHFPQILEARVEVMKFAPLQDLGFSCCEVRKKR